jgi:hypothetical protein
MVAQIERTKTGNSWRRAEMGKVAELKELAPFKAEKI